MFKPFIKSFLIKDSVINSIAKQYISFFVIGLFCFLIDFVILFLIKEALYQNVYLAVIVGFTTATYVSYLLNLRFVFEGGRHAKHKEIIYFFTVAAGSLALTLFLMFIMVDIIFVYYLTAKIITVFLVSVFSFMMRKHIVFLK